MKMQMTTLSLLVGLAGGMVVAVGMQAAIADNHAVPTTSGSPSAPVKLDMPVTPSVPKVKPINAPTSAPTGAPMGGPTSGPVGAPTGVPMGVPAGAPADMPGTPHTMPSVGAPEPSSKTPEPTAVKAKNIVDIASTSDSFKTLTTALKAAGLVDALSSDGPFTVFAPTDAAFAALPKGTLEKLLKPENKDALIQLLSYHVVSGAVRSTDLKTGPVKSVEGSPIQVTVTGGKVTVNRAKVTTANIQASNGVIHAIDHVIIPPVTKAEAKPGK